MARRRKVKTTQLSLLEYAAKNKAAADELRGLLSISATPASTWRGLIATPPGSLLEAVVSCFQTRTNIPLEIPFFATLGFISSHLLQAGAIINFKGQSIKPDLWTVILADSGAGKTFATKAIKDAMSITDTFPECVSGAAFIESLRDNNNSIWLRDEFGQFLKSLETQQGAEIKDYLLRTFDNQKIERKTKKGVVKVDDPAISILGMTVLETFASCINAESLLDGTAQRFNYVIAKKDPERKMIDFPLYDLSGYREKISALWDGLASVPLHNEYNMGSEAVEAFKMSFSMLAGDSIPESFYRRIMFRGVKYALVFHFLRGEPGSELTKEDFAWGARVCWLHLQDAAELLKTHASSDLERTLLNVEKVCRRLVDNGEKVTPRRIVQNVYSIKTVAEAKAALAIVAEGWNDRS